MAAHSGPDVITDGLVLSLDAGNSRSYPGSGTTWTDLSGNNNNGTLTNGPTFDNANGGSLVFDGVDDYVLLGPNITPSNVTINVWFSPLAVDFGKIVRYRLYGYEIAVNTNNLISVGAWADVNTNVGFSSTENYLVNNFYNAVLSIGNSSISFYLNGKIIGTSNFSTNSIYYVSDGTGLTLAKDGGSSSGDSYYNGKIYTFSLYNRALTESEIQQNFNATRGRFGI